MQTEPRAVSVGILKGGFAKTTTALNLARELAHRNERALVVDLDDNGHMTLNLGFEDRYNSTDGDGGNHAEAVLLEGEDPREYVVNVAEGLDLFPAHEDLESVQSALKEATMGTTRLKRDLVDPLLGEEYDYIVIDCPANRGKLNDNAMYATGNLIIPLRPENGYETGLTNTLDRLVQEAREYFNLNILAVVPSDLRKRIDQSTRDRKLLREITTRDAIDHLVPNFAYLSEEDWAAIDADDYDGDLPGIRYRAAIDDAHQEGVPLRDYDPGCDQLGAYDELAAIVERGEVTR
ncbi:ParA family protein [Halobacterium sp. KA-6]|jgi:chromosome partitioning protein|uniref:ParA family protein n=1 Tax=Halobacterium sp. KA-6 TaxID=2896368 RepID=UPI001E44780F|nr:ParA family protein [Halobacterium sp. KA-6]MCD2203364.1 ParA family protein [Halobacterium sp. KA-6]